jgi:tetratricopeptide (TPR) repeat protein
VGVRALRRNIQLCSIGFLALVAQKSPNAFAAEAAQQSGVNNSPSQKAKKLVDLAKLLLANAVPEERSLAEQHLVEATRICRTCPEAYAELGRLWLTDYSLGRAGLSALQRAAAMAESSKELEPNSPVGEYLGVEVLLTIGRQTEAFRLYTSARQVYPEHIETLAFDARLWAEVDPQRALVAAQNAISKGYSVQELSPWIGNAIVRAHGEEKSGEALQRFAEVYPDRWLWHRAAMAYAGQKNWNSAKHAFERAIALGNTLESPLQLAILEYKEMKTPRAAAQRLEALIKVIGAQRLLSDDSRALVESHAAFAHLAANDLPFAKLHAERALELSISNEARVAQIVETFRDSNQLALISSALQRTALNNPLLEDAHLALAMIASQMKDYQSTVEHLSSAIALAPERDDLYSARGQASYLATKYEIALRDFETAIKQKPEHAPYHYNKACLLSLLGRKSEAFESLKTAVFMSDILRDQAGTDSDLENLRRDKEFESRLAQLGIATQLSSVKKAAQDNNSQPAISGSTTLQKVRVGKPE